MTLKCKIKELMVGIDPRDCESIEEDSEVTATDHLSDIQECDLEIKAIGTIEEMAQ